MCVTCADKYKVKVKGRALVTAPQVDDATAETLRYMARTKQPRTYLPYNFPAVAGTHLPTPRGWGGWVSSGPLCKEQQLSLCSNITPVISGRLCLRHTTMKMKIFIHQKTYLFICNSFTYNVIKVVHDCYATARSQRDSKFEPTTSRLLIDRANH